MAQLRRRLKQIHDKREEAGLRLEEALETAELLQEEIRYLTDEHVRLTQERHRLEDDALLRHVYYACQYCENEYPKLAQDAKEHLSAGEENANDLLKDYERLGKEFVACSKTTNQASKAYLSFLKVSHVT